MSEVSARVFADLQLPLWEGILEQAEEKVVLPFVLEAGENGLLVQRHNDLVSQRIQNAYANSAYNFITKPAGYTQWANRMLEPKREFIESYSGGLDNKQILEIGAGSTYLGEYLLDRYEIERYTIMDPSVRETSQRIDIRRDYFSAQTQFDTNIDLVISLSCLEHVPNPITFLRDIHQLLAPNKGVAVVTFPDVTQQLRRGDLNMMLHEHVSYFTMPVVEHLFSRLGFEINQIQVENDLLHISVAALESVQTSEMQIQSNINVRDEIVSLSHELAMSYVSQIQETTTELRKTIQQARDNHQKVGFHGACNGLNILLHLIGLGSATNLFIFDSDTAKTGKYISCFGRPIQHTSDPEYKTMDIVYISAMSFYDEIKNDLDSRAELSNTRRLPLFPLV